MFIKINQWFQKVREWLFGTKKENVEEVINIQEPLINKTIMLNRSKRRFLASKLRKAKHNVRQTKNIKAYQLPHRVDSDDLLAICELAGVRPEELRNV